MPDETPTPRPVVPCEIFFAGERVLVRRVPRIHAHEHAKLRAATVIPALIGDIPALAVPAALWTDRALARAVWSRLQRHDTAVVQDVLAALGVELQARAVVP